MSKHVSKAEIHERNVETLTKDETRDLAQHKKEVSTRTAIEKKVDEVHSEVREAIKRLDDIEGAIKPHAGNPEQPTGTQQETIFSPKKEAVSIPLPSEKSEVPPPKETPTSPERHTHEEEKTVNVSEHIIACPECYSNMLKSLEKSGAKMVKCDGCDKIVPSTFDKCPNCGEEHASEIE